jgi:hypothetical protein
MAFFISTLSYFLCDMTKLDAILEAHPDDSFLKADGFDEAVLGFDENSGRLVYSTSKIIECLVRDGMEHEDAVEYYYFNIAGAYVGDLTPIFVNDLDEVDTEWDS